MLGISATRLSNLDKVLRWLVLQAHGAGLPRPSDDSTAGSKSGSGASARVWEWLSKSGRRGWWGGRYSTLADASRSLLVAEAEA